jgi:hypothetical protein
MSAFDPGYLVRATDPVCLTGTYGSGENGAQIDERSL